MNIYQVHQKKKKNTRKYIKYYIFFLLVKRKKKRLIRDKVEIENVNMKIIKWPQQFHNKSYVTNCYWWVKHVNIEPKLEIVTAYFIRFIVKILGQNCLLPFSAKLISILPFFPN